MNLKALGVRLRPALLGETVSEFEVLGVEGCDVDLPLLKMFVRRDILD